MDLANACRIIVEKMEGYKREENMYTKRVLAHLRREGEMSGKQYQYNRRMMLENRLRVNTLKEVLDGIETALFEERASA